MAAEHKETPPEFKEKSARKRNHPEDADGSAKKKHKYDKKKTIPEHEDNAPASVVPVSFTTPTTTTVLSQKNLSPFSQIRARIYIHLAPIWVGRAVDGVNEQLNAFLMRYVPQFDGVVLAHSNLKILQPNARIMYDSPYCHFWIATDLLVWKPVKASKLVGTINLQSADHIGLLLYGTFNASIPREFIPTAHYEWRPSSSPATPPPEGEGEGEGGPDGEAEDPGFNRQRVQNGEWLVRATGEGVGATDGVVEFTVVDLVQANDMLTVTGALHSPAEKTKERHKDKKEKAKKEKDKKEKDKKEKDKKLKDKKEKGVERDEEMDEGIEIDEEKEKEKPKEKKEKHKKDKDKDKNEKRQREETGAKEVVEAEEGTKKKKKKEKEKN